MAFLTCKFRIHAFQKDALSSGQTDQVRRWWCNFVTCILQTLSDDYKAPVWTENP